jgi:hypothetical protein
MVLIFGSHCLKIINLQRKLEMENISNMPLILSLNLVTNEAEEFFFFPIVDHFDR